MLSYTKKASHIFLTLITEYPLSCSLILILSLFLLFHTVRLLKSKKKTISEKNSPYLKTENSYSFLTKAPKRLSKSISQLFAHKPIIDSTLLEQLHQTLYRADIGAQTTQKLINSLKEQTNNREQISSQKIQSLLAKESYNILNKPDFLKINDTHKNCVFLVVGVNGVGKTTTAAKLANYYKNKNRTVCIGAADTYRAGAIEQLKMWGEKTQIKIIHKKSGSDPASIAFETAQYAKSNQIDISIIDTAGRLQTHENLMEQLAKIKRTLGKVIPGAPHEVFIVLDATTGQNAFSQIKLFQKSADVSGIIMSKLDGTAKGGILLGLSNQFKIPIRFIGIGEKINDLEKFHSQKFVNSIFEITENNRPT